MPRNCAQMAVQNAGNSLGDIGSGGSAEKSCANVSEHRLKESEQTQHSRFFVMRLAGAMAALQLVIIRNIVLRSPAVLGPRIDSPANLPRWINASLGERPHLMTRLFWHGMYRHFIGTSASASLMSMRPGNPLA